MNICRIGIDLAKNVFQLNLVGRQGEAAWKRRVEVAAKSRSMGMAKNQHSMHLRCLTDWSKMKIS